VKVKLAIGAAMKAKRAWSRIPPEQRKKLMDNAAVQVRTHGPAVAKKLSDTAKTHGPAVAKKVGDTAKTQGPVVAKKLADSAKAKGPVVAKKLTDTLERTLNKPPKGS
jgi:acyl-CoA reductase-like NAD-dependent aldehyde dehydrogenase